MCVRSPLSILAPFPEHREVGVVNYLSLLADFLDTLDSPDNNLYDFDQRELLLAESSHNVPGVD